MEGNVNRSGLKSAHLGGGDHIGYRQIETNRESLPKLVGDYYWMADYKEGVIKRWLSDFGIGYRGPDMEIIADERMIPPSIVSHFYPAS
jgi:hypothetical protein